MSNDLILRNDTDGVAELTINRPEAMNAMSRPVIDRLNEHLDDIDADSSVDVVIITGAGDKAFVAGADIKELSQRGPLDGLEAYMQRTYDRLQSFSRPLIAAVNGYAFGGGNELALACDIRVGSTNAQFALPESGLGILPSAGATQRLPGIVGRGLAADMIITGRRIDAAEARNCGLITYLVDPEELLTEAHKVAQRIRRKGPLAVSLIRQLLVRGSRVDHETGILLERLAQSVLFASEEKREGTAAFIEKRHPDFHSARHDR
ncbi:MAG: enoyl-CoA hydratase-related protein [Corynebacterium sp.]|uniref:enoyl-CoA hydratase/isomerase family protein n=1 Tax=Corynebacterium sp. TaxID=1720 RepID=UPI0026DFBC6A|nr:enoyl-CoA hydratase-related protein [Corynebacterium sp.]MDO5670157.1 enoyl-CoA hydratase-related protein [Corynebacterium sp.]